MRIRETYNYKQTHTWKKSTKISVYLPPRFRPLCQPLCDKGRFLGPPEFQEVALGS